jgi:hypothetical protein
MHSPPAHANRIRDLISEKIALLSGDRDLFDPFAGLYYRIGERVPEQHVNVALGATNDFVLRQPLETKKLQRPQVRAYFLKVVKNLCEEHKIETGVKGWWQPQERRGADGK